MTHWQCDRCLQFFVTSAAEVSERWPYEPAAVTRIPGEGKQVGRDMYRVLRGPTDLCGKCASEEPSFRVPCFGMQRVTSER